jgi:hypothetical protein
MGVSSWARYPQVYYAEMTHGPDAFDSTAHQWEHIPYTEAYGMSDKILFY